MMAKCTRCGRGGIFRKINQDGLCKDCAALVEIEKTRDNLNHQIGDLEETLADKQKTYSEIKEKALQDALKEAQVSFKTIEEKRDAAETELKEIEEKISSSTEEWEKREKSAKSAVAKVKRSKEIIKAIKYAEELFSQPETTARDAEVDKLLQDIDNFLQPTVQIELQCMSMRDLKKRYRDNEKEIDETLQKYQSRYTTKANATIYKLMVIALRAELQNILTSIKFGKLETALNNVKEVTAKYYAIAIDGNQNIASTMKKFIGEIEYFFSEAVRIEYEYYVQKERAKEEQRAIREQMHQEAEERRELERQQKQVEKEESKFNNQISQLTTQLEGEQDEEKLHILEARIAELQTQLASVAEKKQQIVNLQNGKAGNVYIISNIGSFGEDVFKIGMTRRLDPQQRVDELGSASVPFPFDVHAMIFSDDAVTLETNLHHIFNERRVNKVNLRKEFFRIPLDELENKVAEIAPSAEFKRTILAEQYRQSLSIDHIGANYSANYSTDEEEDD